MVDRIRVAGLAATVLATLIISLLILEYAFPVFRYAGPRARPAEPIRNETAIIGPQVSRFLWNYRVLDLIAQAFVLFAAAACCVALLRVKERKR
jgi:hypothetical protein